jgi:hypothetical protein
MAAACALSAGTTSAWARPINDATGPLQWGDLSAERTYARRGARTHRNAGANGRGLGPRPGRWCGWWMRTRRGGGSELNVAWNWSRWGRPSTPQVGAVVVWRHHVGEITGRAANGQWIVRSGNDGGRVRERPRSVAGAVFRI